MIRIMVTTTIVSRRDAQKLVHFPLEVEFETLAEVFDSLVEDGAIYGTRPVFKFLDDDRRVITERLPQIVGIHGVATISLCHFELIEQDEVGADE